MPLTVNVVLHRANLDRVEAIVAMAERLGADRLELANVQLVTWALANAALLAADASRSSTDARAVARDARERLAGRMEVVFVLPDWHADRPRACMDGWGRRFVVVAPGRHGASVPRGALPAAVVRERAQRSSRAASGATAKAMRAFRGDGLDARALPSCDRATSTTEAAAARPSR